MTTHIRPIIILTAIAAMALSCGSGASTACRPDCSNKECGDDGCGGSCGGCDDGVSCTTDTCRQGLCYADLDPNYCVISGSCVPSGTLNPSNPCQKCTPKNSSKGWSAEANGVVCGTGAICFDKECCPYAQNCEGKNCGEDGCGGLCGQCGEFEECSAKGVCEEKVCEGGCDGKDCGFDECGKSCGTCPGGNECQDGACICVPKCAGKECGDDSCNGTCGTCTGVNRTCQSGKCVCSGESCGDNCCGPGQVCVGGDYCCLPKCDGKECGDNACGGECGQCNFENAVCLEGKCECPGWTCPGGCCGDPKEVCDPEGECCLPQCEGKECGDDGCGAVCGLCAAGQICLTGVCPPEGWECIDDNTEEWDGCTTDGDVAEFRVNTYQLDAQQAPDVASLPNGRYVVVWESFQQDAVGWGIFGQRFTVDSKAEGSEFKVNAFQTDNQRNPAVAAFADNRFVVVWDSFGQETGDAVGKGVFAQLYGPDGAKQNSEFNVNGGSANGVVGNQFNADVATFPDNSFVVVWEGEMMNTNGSFVWDEIFFRRFDASGTPLGVTVVANKGPTADPLTPMANIQSEGDVAVLSNGNFVIAWQGLSQPGDTSGYGVFFRIFASDGTPVTDQIQANTYTSGDQQKPSVAALPTGGFALTWESQGQDGDNNSVILQLYQNDGTTTTGEILVNSTAVNSQQDPSLSVFPNGSMVVVWESREQDGSQGGIYAQRFNADASKYGGEIQVNFYTHSNQWRPVVATPVNPWYVVVWDGAGQDSDLFGIFARRFDSNTNEALYH